VASTDLDNPACRRVLENNALRLVRADEKQRFYERPSR